MPVHGTTLKLIYNRPDDKGKATDIQDEDLVYLQRGEGSDRDKAIKGSDIKISNGKVLADSEDTVPKTLYGKLLDSSTIAFNKTTQGSAPGNRYVTAGVKDGSIDTQHLKDAAVESSKIEDGAVTTAKIPDGNITSNKLANNSVTGKKVNMSIIDSQHSQVQVTTSEVVSTDQGFSTCDKVVHTFSGAETGGFIDVNVYFDALQSDDLMTDVKLEIRKSGSSTAESTFDIGTPSTTSTVSRRMIVKNGVSSTANYELHLICKTNFVSGTTPISGFQACNVDIRGIIVA